MRGQSILVIYEPLPQHGQPFYQQQCPTELAEYIKGLIEKDQSERNRKEAEERQIRSIQDVADAGERGV